MYKKSLLPILFGLFTILLVVSCDKDFNELGTNIVGEDHYGFERYSDATIKSYNQKLGAIASNNLPINPLGIYNNPAFGTTEANFVTQIELAVVNPKFNNVTPGDYQTPTAIDSVILDIPYFKTLVATEEGKNTYVLDSIYGPNSATGIAESTFKLDVYQSNYFLRDLDPGQALGENQAFYTDENSTIDGHKVGAPLNNDPNTRENTNFFFDKREHRTMVLDDDNEPVYTRSVPSMRLHLDKATFTSLILNAPSGKLTDNTAFKNYFRGLYFKVTQNSSAGNMAMINFKAGKITMYYKDDKKVTTNGTTTFTREDKTLTMNLTGNSVSLLENRNEDLNYLNAANSPNEASKLYLKGGQGAISIIDLFGSADNYKFVLRTDGSGNPIDENGNAIPLDSNGDPRTGYFLTYQKVNTPNGVSDELDELRYPALENSVYHSTKNRWMINEANLIFNIDNKSNSAASAIKPMDDVSAIEPNRIYLYDLTNNKVLVDYTYDFTTNSFFPKFNKGVFGGILLDENGRLKKQREDNTGVYKYKGNKYKIRITNHIRNLVKNDSTNVRLGLAVTESIGNILFSKLKTPNSNTKQAPTMSVMNPLGTILYGTNIPATDPDYGKRLKLEIYYTKPN